MLGLPTIASAALALAPPTDSPQPGHSVAPLSAPALRLSSPSPLAPPSRAPLDNHTQPPSPQTTSLPPSGAAPLATLNPASTAPTPTAPLGQWPPPPPDRLAPRRIDLIRLEALFGPVWRTRPAEMQLLASVEFGHMQGFSGTVQGGVIVAPDRAVIEVADYPLGAGFVYRRRLGQRSLYGSVGLTAGLLIHRAATDRGVIHRVDPDLQLPLRFAWTVGNIGFSLALLQGFSTRSRTYERRGTEVWHRIPYRIGFAVGIHFDVGVGPTRSRRSSRAPKAPP